MVEPVLTGTDEELAAAYAEEMQWPPEAPTGTYNVFTTPVSFDLSVVQGDDAYAKTFKVGERAEFLTGVTAEYADGMAILKSFQDRFAVITIEDETGKVVKTYNGDLINAQ
jgi:hypothetical protein